MGNAPPQYADDAVLPVHPHGCGERVGRCRWPVNASGSSPRLWGTPLLVKIIRFNYRFIPTAVGNARAKRPRATPRPVHPHGCGERPPLFKAFIHQNGSSPRLWGTQDDALPRDQDARFIPTAVGNAQRGSQSKKTFAVHPHGCGERQLTADAAQLSSGSSPRLWGTRVFMWLVQPS